MNRCAIFIVFALFVPLRAVQADSTAAALPVTDTHIHYSEDVWTAIPPQSAIQRLRDAGIHQAWVSSTPDEGTRRLYAADPHFVIPVLRPYRHGGDRDTWAHDETIIEYLEQRLKKHRYAAIGEFHLIDNDANSPVIRKVAELAKQHQLILHVHADAKSIETLFRIDPDAKILWAHAGFEYGDDVKRMLDRYPNLWADLSYRREIYQNGRFLPSWRELLIKHADRFTLGVDTYTPQRWLQIGQVMNWQRSMLEKLPRAVAERIATQNAQALVRHSGWQ